MMSSISSEIQRYSNKANMTCSEEKNRSIKTDPRLTQRLDSAGKDNIIIAHVFKK